MGIAPGKLRGVEAVRGLAALMVVLFHAGTLLAGPKDYGRLAFGGAFLFGRAGVDVFFVLSGFIITLVHAQDIGRPRRLAPFARKRLLRIYPSYWIATLVLLAIMLVSPTPDRREHDAGFVLSSLLLLPAQGEPLLGPGWSLRHELLFYALFGVSLLNRRLGAAVLGLWFGAILVNIAAVLCIGAPVAGGLAGSWLLAPINIEFLAGIGATALLLAAPIRRPLCLVAAGACIFAAMAAVEVAVPAMKEAPPLHLGYALAAFLGLLGVAARERSRGLAVPAFLVRLGEASYALYLLHVIVIMLGVFVLRQLHPYLALPLAPAFVLLVATAIAVSFAYTSLIERPLLKWLRQVTTPAGVLLIERPNS